MGNLLWIQPMQLIKNALNCHSATRICERNVFMCPLPHVPSRTPTAHDYSSGNTMSWLWWETLKSTLSLASHGHTDKNVHLEPRTDAKPYKATGDRKESQAIYLLVCISTTFTLIMKRCVISFLSKQHTVHTKVFSLAGGRWIPPDPATTS